MIFRTLYIGRWTVDFIFAVDGYDTEKILDILYGAGASYGVLTRTREIMESGALNTGFCYPDPELYYAIVAVGPTSSGSEFVDTVVHEVHHLAVAIADELGIDLESETPAYISGDATRALADVICELGCTKCHSKG